MKTVVKRDTILTYSNLTLIIITNNYKYRLSSRIEYQNKSMKLHIHSKMYASVKFGLN
jgi:hypothetical protein